MVVVLMPKGRGSNEARRNRRLAGRSGGGSQSGRTRTQILARLPEEKRTGWWRRVKEWARRRFMDVEATVAPKRAMRRVERLHHQRKQTVGEVKQTRAIGQQRRKT
jgi:hypothetical protein